MIDPRDTSSVALKIVFCLSLVLVTMDSLEVFYSFKQLKYASQNLEPDFFNKCIKYHLISQIFFTVFATFAGFSACSMSFGLIVSYTFFQNKALSTFLYWNYMVFGPFLLGSVILAFFNWNEVLYYCNPKQTSEQYFNFSTLMALLICFIFSSLITIGYAIWNTVHLMIQSVRFRPDGNRVIGRLFWDYIINREQPDVNQRQAEQVEVRQVQPVDSNLDNNLQENLL